MKNKFLTIATLLALFPAFALACSSDFECGIGNRCVKAPLQSQGACMKSVDEYGIQQYDMPRSESVGPNMNLEGDCNFDTDCPIGFACNRRYKACVKR